MIVFARPPFDSRLSAACVWGVSSIVASAQVTLSGKAGRAWAGQESIGGPGAVSVLSRGGGDSRGRGGQGGGGGLQGGSSQLSARRLTALKEAETAQLEMLGALQVALPWVVGGVWYKRIYRVSRARALENKMGAKRCGNPSFFFVL